jgi:glucokinase-like ROK family protein
MKSHYTAVDQTVVRESNLSSVLRHLHEQITLSRAQIANATGLNKSTVSSLVDELIEGRLIYETGTNSGNAGRPATLLEINPNAGGIVGMELGVDFVSVVLTNFLGDILWQKIENADPAKKVDSTIKQSLRVINAAIAEGKARNLRILGLGLAIPGMVDVKEGVLVLAPNLNWRNVPLRKICEEDTGLPVFVDNDANAAAIGEHLFGVGKQIRDFIFIYAGTGIGGGLFLSNELYRGKNGFAGEFGHAPIISNSFQVPNNGLGDWEAYASQNSIIQRVRTSLETGQESILDHLMQKRKASLSILLIKEAADGGDKVSLEAFANTGEALGVGIANLVNTFNPEMVILGGPLSAVGNYLLPSIKVTVENLAFPEMSKYVEIINSEFGENASVIGAIALVVNDILSNPTHVKKEVI